MLPDCRQEGWGDMGWGKKDDSQRESRNIGKKQGINPTTIGVVIIDVENKTVLGTLSRVHKVS